MTERQPATAGRTEAHDAGGPALPVRIVPWEGAGSEPEPLLSREWLVTNGLGGYACGTLSGVATRRYHGFLVAALPPPFGRTMMLNHLTELVRLPDGRTLLFAGAELVGRKLELHGVDELEHFRLEGGLPVWRYRIGDTVLERQVFMPHERNTVHVVYRLLAGPGPLRLKLRPGLHFRNHDAHVSVSLADPYVLTAHDDRYEVADASDLPPLRMVLHGTRTAFTAERQRLQGRLYRTEENRGYESVGDMWALGYFRADLAADAPVTLVASTEAWEDFADEPPADALARELARRRELLARAAPGARTGAAAELVLAADQFVVAPAYRQEPVGGEPAPLANLRSVVAGYHWFTDWGRDTMIGLEGLTLATGRAGEARHVLRTFAGAMRDGLVPNLFPEGGSEGLYHTADATLWFFHALHRYLAATGDRDTLRDLLPKLLGSVRHHLDGTRFGIRVDPTDGLVCQGQHGYQLTWMDAKVGDWVVTPRRGKAVEINALWYNALRLLARWAAEEGVATDLPLAEAAARCKESFARRFWCAEAGHLYDVVDCDGEAGRDDPALRPNQLFAFSLEHPVLERGRWESVLQVVSRELLTPVGLRSLARDHPAYQPRYFGDLRARDAAYHQGTVWGWLIGPFVDCWLRVHPGDRRGARQALQGLLAHLDDACIGSMSEIFDAEPPFTPRGCVAQAWTVAEVLRCWLATGGEAGEMETREALDVEPARAGR